MASTAKAVSGEGTALDRTPPVMTTSPGFQKPLNTLDPMPGSVSSVVIPNS